MDPATFWKDLFCLWVWWPQMLPPSLQDQPSPALENSKVEAGGHRCPRTL